MAVKTYDPLQIIIVFGGFIIDGFADGTFVTIDFNNDLYTLKMGSQGDGTRSKSNDLSALITVTLQQTSPSNASFQGLKTADELRNAGIASFLMKDLLGNDLATAETAWIRKSPTNENAKESGTRAWPIETDNLTMLTLGH